MVALVTGTQNATSWCVPRSSPHSFLIPDLACQVTNVSIGLAVFSFYILDFALNALQASLRNLLLDITPSEQLNTGNAWHSRMIQAGSIVGYAFGASTVRMYAYPADRGILLIG